MNYNTALSFTLTLIHILLNIAASDIEECDVRYRRSWYSLTDQEQLLYITAFQQIRKNGALSAITSSYSKSIQQTRDTSLFFFIHEHYVYEAENAIRSLGAPYNCFSMPYWDFSRDASLEHDAPIFKTGLGADGDTHNNYCIQSASSNWDLCSDNTDESALCYWSPFDINCAETETDSMCCLKRSLSTTRTLASSIEIAYAIQSNKDFEAFTTHIKRFNDYIHAFIGSNDECPMSNAMSSEDPILFLLSSFIGYIRSLWSDCNDYDISVLSNIHTDAILNDIFYDLNDVKWSKVSIQSISVQSLYDITELNIVYDLGSFWRLSKLNIWCEGSINDNMFVSDDADKDISYTNSPLQQYVDKTWNVLDEAGMNDDDKFYALSALGCDYVRRESLNSCFNAEMLNRNNEGMCNDMSVEELKALTLEHMYGYVGDDDGCLLRIRDDTWSYVKRNVVLKQALCNGEFDYKCNVWIGDEYDGYDDISGILSQDSSEIQDIYPSSPRDFLVFDTSLWSVLVWCSMFIFIFMMCCYMFGVKKDYENETIYKKNRKTAHVAIYGAVGSV